MLFGKVFTCRAAQSIVNFDRNSIVARVDRGSITLDQVMEVFGPAYYEIINRARTKNISRELDQCRTAEGLGQSGKCCCT